ncbi:MAG: nitroreductase family protein [bacterium]
MELKEAIIGRRSIRKYKPDPIPKEDIETIIELASWAPSGSNMQQWKFIVIQDAILKEKLKDAIENVAREIFNKYKNDTDLVKRLQNSLPAYTFFINAPIVIACIVEEVPSTSGKIMDSRGVYSSTISIVGLSSISAAIQNLLLTAFSMGYGTCWMTGPLIAKKEMEEILEIKRPHHLVALIPIGKPDEVPIPKPRRKGIIEYR